MENGNCYLELRSRFYDKKLFDIFIFSESGKSYRYAELELKSSRYVRFLKKNGVRVGDRVCIRLENTFDMVCLYVACIRYGAIFVPIKSTLGMYEMEHVIKDVQPSFLFFPLSQADLFKTLPILEWKPDMGICTYGFKSELEKRSKYLLPLLSVQKVEPHDIACISYTSGTTGKPKGVMLSHQSISLGVKTLAELWGFSYEDTVLFPHSLSHNLGFFAFNLGLYSGSRIILVEKWDNSRIANLLPLSTVFFGTPLIYKQLIASSFLSRQRLVSCRLFISGTSSLPESVYKEFYEVTGKRIIDRYGMTETIVTTSNNTHYPIAGSVGKPIPGVSLRVVDEKSMSVDVGEIGYIEIKSPYLFKGYWNNDAKTQEAFKPDGYFVTGDMGKLDEQGNVWLMARSKEVIISTYGKIYPREVEIYIEGVEGVESVAVLGVPHPEIHECAIAVVQCIRGEREVEESTIINHLRASISLAKIPRKIIFIEKLPRTETGKIQKNILFEKYKHMFLF